MVWGTNGMMLNHPKSSASFQEFLQSLTERTSETFNRVRKPKNQYHQNNLQSIVMCWGLIKKILLWQQISCIPSSENLGKFASKIHASRPDGQRASMFTIFCTQVATWLRREQSGKCCSISCNSIMLLVTNC